MIDLFNHEAKMLMKQGWVLVPMKDGPESMMFVHPQYKFFIIFMLRKITDNVGDEEVDTNFHLCFGYPSYVRLPGRLEFCEIKTVKKPMNILDINGPNIRDIVAQAVAKWPGQIE